MMQQTEKYKLNLIEPSDPFLPDGLNQNTQKIEEAMTAHEEKVDDQIADMDQRVAALETHKFYVGTYMGDGTGTPRFVDLGFTPLAVCVSYSGEVFWAFKGAVSASSTLAVVEGGINAGRLVMSGTLNDANHVYPFLAFT